MSVIKADSTENTDLSTKIYNLSTIKCKLSTK
nr:MAG TPA: hypothetical protein [Caudoviricetes sp.]